MSHLKGDELSQQQYYAYFEARLQVTVTIEHLLSILLLS